MGPKEMRINPLGRYEKKKKKSGRGKRVGELVGSKWGGPRVRFEGVPKKKRGGPLRHSQATDYRRAEEEARQRKPKTKKEGLFYVSKSHPYEKGATHV